MERRPLAIMAVLALAACGRPNATGVYLYQSDHEVALVQLAQTPQGAVTGRLEAVSLGAGGVIEDRSATLDGALSGGALTFKPVPGAFASLTAGSVSGGGVELTGGGLDLKARRSTLAAYQAALSKLQLKAAIERRVDAAAQDQRAQTAANTPDVTKAADKVGALGAAAAALRDASAKLDAGVAASPDFARQSADNTARMAQLAAQAAKATDRGPLLASANQLVVGTNQIDVARTQYAVGLNRIVYSASPLALDVERFCDAPAAAPLSQPCAQAMAAGDDFNRSLVHASVVFKRHKMAIQANLARQNDLMQSMGG
jgi:hypothetical protein